jgi:hypothetical protein
MRRSEDASNEVYAERADGHEGTRARFDAAAC